MTKKIGFALIMSAFYFSFINGAVNVVCAAEYKIELVKDIRPGFRALPAGYDVRIDPTGTIGQTSNPSYLTEHNGLLVFNADDGAHGRELWKSDGTKAGTVMIMDIFPGVDGSMPNGNIRYKGMVVFTADDGGLGRELWKSDGTEAGTVMVKDICPGVDGSGSSLFLGKMFEYNGMLFFAADDGVHGDELWKTDGTEAGTVMVKDIWPGVDGSLSFYGQFDELMFEYNGMLFFNADDGVHGVEVWKTDGTEAGTVMVKDIWPGVDGSQRAPVRTDNFEYDGALYFNADDGVHGEELWKTDGTEAGTVMVKDIWPGADDSRPFKNIIYNGMLFFNANDGVHGVEVWKTDGTEAGTVMLKDIRPGEMYSCSQHPMMSGIMFVEYNGMLFFDANDGVHGVEVWKTDGTEAGTVMLKDIWPESGYSYTNFGRHMFEYNGMLFFAADDGTWPEYQSAGLWKTDGTEAGTVLVNKRFRDNVYYFFEYDGTLFFKTTRIPAYFPQYTLSSTDGTKDGTKIIANRLLKFIDSSRLKNNTTFLQVNGTMYFDGRNFLIGEELWNLQPVATQAP